MLFRRLHQSSVAQALKARLFALSRHHYSNHRWYGHYKHRELKRALATPFPQGQLPPGYGRWLDERLVEYPWLFSQLTEDSGTLLDAGSTLNHALILDYPRLCQREITIMTLAPEEYCREGVSYIYGDLRKTHFPNNSFNTVVSLSVLEHVGMNNARYAAGVSAAENPESYLDAVVEFRRILKPGGSFLISVPFGKRDVRSWLQVFDSSMISQVIEIFSPTWYEVQYFRYSKHEQWERCDSASAADAPYFDLTSDKPWPGCPAGAGAIACLHLKK
jgi:SAM-dependent methyltransferase